MNKQTLKRVIAFLLLGALVLGIIPLAVLAAEAEDAYVKQVVCKEGECPVCVSSGSSIGIIGGADGPTAILVSGNWIGMAAIAGVLVCAGIAVIVALKQRKK